MKHNMRADLVVRDVLYWVMYCTGSQPTTKTTTTMATTTTAVNL